LLKKAENLCLSGLLTYTRTDQLDRFPRSAEKKAASKLMSGALLDHLGKSLSRRINEVQSMLKHIKQVGPNLPESTSKRLSENLLLIPLKLRPVIIKQRPELLTTFSDIVDECSGLLRLYTESVCKVPYNATLAVIPENGEEGGHHQNLGTRFKTFLGKLSSTSGQKERDLLSKLAARADDLEKLSKVDVEGFPIPVAVGQENGS
jgi:hypothetical protein